MKLYRPDTEEFVPSTETDFTPKIFLAGSIEMGKAEDWQTAIIEKLKDKDVIIFNPRRDDWDPTWEQTKDNPEFYKQVTWELEHLELADWIILYLDPNTKSPITLLELGIHSQANKLIVCCPEGFYRKGNIDITCEYYGIPCTDDKEQFFNNQIFQLLSDKKNG